MKLYTIHEYHVAALASCILLAAPYPTAVPTVIPFHYRPPLSMVGSYRRLLPYLLLQLSKDWRAVVLIDVMMDLIMDLMMNSISLTTREGRPGLMFYEWDTVDPDEDAERLQQLAPNVDDGAFAGEVNQSVNWTVDRKQHHTLHESGQDPTKRDSASSMRSAETPVQLDDNMERTYGSAYQPLIRVSWTRVFHPRPQTHALLANLVLDRMDLEHEKTMARMRYDTQRHPMELK